MLKETNRPDNFQGRDPKANTLPEAYGINLEHHGHYEPQNGVMKWIDMRGVVHGERHARHDHHDQRDGQHGAERVGVVQVARHRVGDEAVIGQSRQRQALVHPRADARGGLVVPMVLEADAVLLRERVPRGVLALEVVRPAGFFQHGRVSGQPISITPSETKASCGMGRLVGAGPRRMRPTVS